MKPVILDVAPDGVVSWWPHVSRYLSDALKHTDDEMTLFDVHQALQRGDMWLLVSTTGNESNWADAAFVVQVHEYPRCKALHVFLAGGGHIREWIEPLVEKLEQGCATIGATRIEFCGRLGFERVLREYATTTHFVLVRRLDDVEAKGANSHIDEEPVGTRREHHRKRRAAGGSRLDEHPADLHRPELHRTERIDAAGRSALAGLLQRGGAE